MILRYIYDETIDYNFITQEKNKKNVLIVDHGNSLRALMMYLEDISHSAIANVNVHTGIPRVYDMDEHLKIKTANKNSISSNKNIYR